jgi:hypothetical protein
MSDEVAQGQAARGGGEKWAAGFGVDHGVA